jgi:hypothetical protein
MQHEHFVSLYLPPKKLDKVVRCPNVLQVIRVSVKMHLWKEGIFGPFVKKIFVDLVENLMAMIVP